MKRLLELQNQKLKTSKAYNILHSAGRHLILRIFTDIVFETICCYCKWLLGLHIADISFPHQTLLQKCFITYICRVS